MRFMNGAKDAKFLAGAWALFMNEDASTLGRLRKKHDVRVGD